MPLPYYVSPEQMMRDKAEYARKGIARGKSIVALEAMIDAAEEDIGTGGPDLVRGIFPSVKIITRSGFGEVTEDEVRRACEAILAERRGQP